MLMHIRLENFKSWRELDIPLAPITLLFGTNSSGKSSLLQALLMLKQTVLSYDRTLALNLGGERSDYVDLGSYRDVIYRHSLERNLLLFLKWTQTPSHQRNLFSASTPNQLDYEVIWQATDEVTRQESLTSEQFGERIALEDLLKSITHLAPLRAYPKRTYLLRGNAPQEVSRFGENAIEVLLTTQRRSPETLRAVANGLVQLGLAESFEIRPLDPDGRFYEPRLTISGQDVALADVGSGVSQVLPVITMLYTAPEGAILLLEHPELHLHPSAQAALADVMLDAAATRHMQLIVESHSEHLLARFQRRIAERASPFATPQNIHAYFCQPSPEGSHIQPVEVNAYGQIVNYPENFFGDLSGDFEAMTRAGLRTRRQELEAAAREKPADEC